MTKSKKLPLKKKRGQPGRIGAAQDGVELAIR